jgi:alanyl-tRNA synthetase
MEITLQKCIRLRGEPLHNFGNKLQHSHIFQSMAPFVLEIFEMRWGKTSHFFKLV